MKELTKKEQNIIDAWLDERFEKRFEKKSKSYDLYTGKDGLDYLVKIKFIR